MNLKSTLLLILGFSMSLFGCGKANEPWQIVHRVEGIVTFRGKPLADANITLIPVDTDFPSSVRPTARSNEDGSFSIGTYSTSDGAPAGEYKVLVLHFPVLVSVSNAVSGPNDLPRKYSNAETTTLSVTIDEGGNELLPIELE